MLDEFFSDNPNDYLAGFPSHPHRGFEAVTYMIDGHMRHEDHLGNQGDLGPGDAQWMTAGRGVIHSEMPQQSEGRMRGFQLWINLPAKEKMKPASWRDIAASDIPVVPIPAGGQVKVIAGIYEGTAGPINGHEKKLTTDPSYLDVSLPAGSEVVVPVSPGYHAFIYMYEGSATIGDVGEGSLLPYRSAGVLSDSGNVRVLALEQGARFLLLAAKPIREPVVQYGPFVMNTREEIEQTLADYRDGNFT